ncbi:MAG: LysE family translocator [Pseudonocardia sp.]|nr:LysE family translocator [Pseudonocardia sp.]
MTLLAFVGVSAVVIMTPGPDTAVTVRAALGGGRRGGVLTALGVATGQTVWALATGAGVVALLIASEPLFLAVKYAGAAYLMFLGVQGLRAAFRRPETGVAVAAGRRRVRPLAAYRQGLLSDLGNPKMAVFFASLLPQFAPPGSATFGMLVLLGTLFAAMTFGWLALYSAVIARAGEVLRRPRLRRAVEGVTGTLLVGLGARVAVGP